MRPCYPLLLSALCGLLLAPAAASAASWNIKGAGWGHGIGMSQYGAYGFAKHGYSHKRILSHYFRGTQLSRTSSDTVRVLLQSNRKQISLRRASEVNGQALDPALTYKVRAVSGRLEVLQADQVVLRTQQASFRSARVVQLLGKAENGVSGGAYRGQIVVRATPKRLQAVNHVGLESYLYGVVPSEIPSLWPTEALRAQAVAARSYALSTTKKGDGFDHYADVRSQMYRGYSGEFPSTSRAVDDTRATVVTYKGQVITTFFFSTSGGRTEGVENVWGSAARPYLRSVRDPYDGASPYHRWNVKLSQAQMEAKLAGLFSGRFRGVKVLRRGRSPRVVEAKVLGSKASSVTSGANLRYLLGLRDTWFTVRRAG